MRTTLVTATWWEYSLTCLDADPTVHSISCSPLPAATGVRGPEGFGSGNSLPGRGCRLWSERRDRRETSFHPLCNKRARGDDLNV